MREENLRDLAEVQQQIYGVVKGMASRETQPEQKRVRLEVERYLFGRLHSKGTARITMSKLEEHIKQALCQEDCEVMLEGGCIAKVVRLETGAPKKFVARYFIESSTSQ